MSPRSTTLPTPKPRRAQLTWDEAIARYLVHLRAARFSPRTIEGVQEKLRHLSQRFQASSHPGEVALPDLRAFQAGLFNGSTTASGKPMSARGVANLSSCLRKFFRFLVTEELIDEDPAQRLEQPRCPRRAVGDVLSVTEVTRLLATAAAQATTTGRCSRCSMPPDCAGLSSWPSTSVTSSATPASWSSAAARATRAGASR